MNKYFIHYAAWIAIEAKDEKTALEEFFYKHQMENADVKHVSEVKRDEHYDAESVQSTLGWP